jgi:hypothetical protein
MYRRWAVVFLFFSSIGWCQQNSAPSLTIYNQDFAVVREMIPLQLNGGVNQISFEGATSFLEPSSVMLRDPAGKLHFSILEQNYRTDIASQQNLLRAYEGKEIEFQVAAGQIVRGEIIRAGGTAYGANGCYGGNCGYSGETIIEINGKIVFGLPGTPIFPALQNESLLKPSLNWLLQLDHSAQLNAELSYITGGLTWEASYNVVAPENGDLLDMIGWVTLQNRSGHTFENARLQLMAGEVNKVKMQEMALAAPMSANGGNDLTYIQPPVKETVFDEYHLYSLQRSSTLENGETKQVEFIRANSIPSKRLYSYEGYMLPENLRGNMDYQFQQPNIGVTSNKQVYIMREFRNSEADHLGMPLPRGRMRFYRRDSEGQLQFIGENEIQHTPKDETLRVYTGNAFDLVADRTRTEFKIDGAQRWIEETYVIKLRNHKKEAVAVQVVEHLYRCDNWAITSKSVDYVKKDSHTVEFTANIPPDGEQDVMYSVHYTW